eukprot:2194553-Amphidinium_carterae.2
MHKHQHAKPAKVVGLMYCFANVQDMLLSSAMRLVPFLKVQPRSWIPSNPLQETVIDANNNELAHALPTFFAFPLNHDSTTSFQHSRHFPALPLPLPHESSAHSKYHICLSYMIFDSILPFSSGSGRRITAEDLQQQSHHKVRAAVVNKIQVTPPESSRTFQDDAISNRLQHGWIAHRPHTDFLLDLVN